MTRHQLRLKILRAGYSIPHSMEWMFWPMMGVGFKVEPLARRYKVTNIAEYTKVLLELGAIREVK